MWYVWRCPSVSRLWWMIWVWELGVSSWRVLFLLLFDEWENCLYAKHKTKWRNSYTLGKELQVLSNFVMHGNFSSILISPTPPPQHIFCFLKHRKKSHNGNYFTIGWTHLSHYWFSNISNSKPAIVLTKINTFAAPQEDLSTSSSIVT